MAKSNALKILLVDGNLRHPTLHAAFKCKKGRGLSNVIMGDADIKDVVRETALQNLSLITAGNSDVDPMDVLESCRFEELVAKLKDKYDYLVFDSPPINAYSDASILSHRVDGVIFVVRAGKTRWEVAQSAKEQLERSHANIIGVVLNRKKYIIPRFLYRRL